MIPRPCTATVSVIKSSSRLSVLKLKRTKTRRGGRRRSHFNILLLATIIHLLPVIIMRPRERAERGKEGVRRTNRCDQEGKREGEDSDSDCNGVDAPTFLCRMKRGNEQRTPMSYLRFSPFPSQKSLNSRAQKCKYTCLPASQE